MGSNQPLAQWIKDLFPGGKRPGCGLTTQHVEGVACRKGLQGLLEGEFYLLCLLLAENICTALMFLLPTNALLYYTYKMLKYTVKTSHYRSYCIF